MTVSGVNPTSSGGTSSLTGDASTIAGNFEQFLTLLTTQLQNQNPLDPLDTNQFTQQLVAFSSVEQQLKTNTYLEAMMEANRNQAANEAVSYIGKTVTTSGTTADLAGGSATWSFDLPQAAHVEISIRDSAGNVVKTDSADLAAGKGTYVWDGTTDNGGTSPPGAYSISIDARSKSGAFVAASTEASGVVTGVDLSGNEPELIVGTSRYRLSTITSVLAS